MSKNSKIIIAVFCFARLILHLVADSNSGFQGDELLHIQTGNHLSFGYMEFPPLIGLLAFIQNSFNSTSVYVHHIFAHIASVLIFAYLAKTVHQLGGKTKAIFLLLLCILPIMGRAQQLFQPVVFSQLFWILSFYHLTCYIKHKQSKYLWYLTFSVTLGFLTKYDIVFFILGLPALLLFRSERNLLIKHKFWINSIAFLALISPNIIWQYLNEFPAVKMFSRLYETQLLKISTTEMVTELFLSINPINILLLIPGIIAMFHSTMKPFRPLSATIMLSAAILFFSDGKSYYFYPVVLIIFTYGAVFWEKIIITNRNYLFYPLIAILSISAFFYVPFSLPITSLSSYLKHQYKYEKKDIQGGKYAVRVERYSKQSWKETLNNLKNIYDSLPPNEQKESLIWGKHYGQAGGIELFRKNYNLPPAFSYHGSFYLWAPTGKMPETVIAIRSSTAAGKDFFEPFFEEVIPVKSIYNPYADSEEKLWQTIFICKKPKQSFDKLKVAFKNRVFE